MAFIGELNFYEDSCIFFIIFSEKEYQSIELGDEDKGNKLILTLDWMNNICGLYLVSTRLVYLGTPQITIPEEGLNWNPGPIVMVREDDYGNILLLDDFELYLDDTGLTFLFGTEDELNNNKGTIAIDNKYESSKVMYGYDKDLRLKCIKIKDIPKQRHNLFVSTMRELGIPLKQAF